MPWTTIMSGEARTRRHLRCPAGGTGPHVDDRGWEAFRRGAVDGELAPPRTPAAAPWPGRYRRSSWLSISR